MAEPSFDPGGFYEFNLVEGAVHTRSGARVLVLSDNVLAPLVSAAVQHGDLTAVRRMGKVMGEHIRESLGKDASACSPETVLGHTASTLGLFGWGRLTFERWGQVLAAVVDGQPQLDEDNLGLAALLGGVFSVLAGREVACVPIDPRRFLVVSPYIAEQVWMWSREGADLPTLVARLATEGSA